MILKIFVIVLILLINNGCSVWYKQVKINSGDKAELARDVRVYVYTDDNGDGVDEIKYVDAKGGCGWFLGRADQ